MISDWALAVSLRSPNYFLSIIYHNKSCGDRTIIAVSPYGACSTCLQVTVLRFLKICKSADYYKFVEAMMIVEHRRVILRTPDENAKIGIVRSSHDNRRPNVTYALFIVVIDVRMNWALCQLDNLGRTEARPRLKSHLKHWRSTRLNQR